MTTLPAGYTLSPDGTRVIDKRGNSVTLARHTTLEAAVVALQSNVDSHDCSDCTYCHSCTDCRGCRSCTYCRGCRSCTYCRDCSDCTYCRDCSDCTYCHDCRSCTDCHDCHDWSGSTPPVPVPVVPSIHQRVHDAVTSTPEALAMDAWHRCETTHCRAGWVVHLAGDAGYALEASCSTDTAALLIYAASSPEVPDADRFHDGNSEAMEDIASCAARERERERTGTNDND